MTDLGWLIDTGPRLEPHLALAFAFELDPALQYAAQARNLATLGAARPGCQASLGCAGVSRMS